MTVLGYRGAGGPRAGMAGPDQAWLNGSGAVRGAGRGFGFLQQVLAAAEHFGEVEQRVFQLDADAVAVTIGGAVADLAQQHGIVKINAQGGVAFDAAGDAETGAAAGDVHQNPVKLLWRRAQQGDADGTVKGNTGFCAALHMGRIGSGPESMRESGAR